QAVLADVLGRVAEVTLGRQRRAFGVRVAASGRMVPSARVARPGCLLAGSARRARQGAATNGGTPSLHQQLRAGPEKLAIFDRNGEDGGRGLDVTPPTQEGGNVDVGVERQ